MNSQRALISTLLSAAGVTHAFFTRLGGVSEPPYDTLSFSETVGDRPECVRENLARAGADLGVDPARIFFLRQVHSADVHSLSASDSLEVVHALSGDAIVSKDPRIACGVRVADCAPVLIADRTSGAVGAVHSGWRGTVQNVVGAAVRALRELAGPHVDVVAAIGPHIESCCFEVGTDVAEQIIHASPVKDIVRPGAQGRPHMDLRAVLRAQLREAGVSDSQIDDVCGCTKCDRSRFFSYRRDGPKSGRHLSAIVPVVQRV